MAKEISIVHHADRRTDVVMPYAPGIVVRRGSLVFLSGVTAAAVYHSHPHRDEEFDLPATMEAQAVRAMENLKKTLEADRKSTRLNSSHGYISYAGFCLEKKTSRTY